MNKCDPENIPPLRASAEEILSAESIMKLFKRKMKEAKAAKKAGERRSQLGFIRIVMQSARLAWRMEIGPEIAEVTTLARISLSK